MKSKFFILLLLVLLAAVFFDDPNPYPATWKRIVYSFFLYLAIWDMIYIYLLYTQRKVHFPNMFKIFALLFGAFIIINFGFSLISPQFNLVTLINNPYAMLSAIPVFAFGIGYLSPEKEVMQACAVSTLLFMIFMFFPTFSSPRYYAGYVTSAGLIPGFVFALHAKKNHLIYLLLLACACVYSQVSDYRIIMLKVILFFGLFTSLNLFKNNKFMKVAVISVTFFLTLEVVSNFEQFLEFFQKTFHLQKFDATDTRSFLYEELFKDIKGSELIYGRGFLGSYFSKYFFELQLLHNDYSDAFQRYSIEVGFLELILKGGFIYVLFYFIPLLYASFKSILGRNTDQLTFNLGIFILTEVIALFIENVPLFNFDSFLMFFVSGLIFRRINKSKPQSFTKPTISKPQPAYA